MFAIIYSFQIKPGHEAQFEKAWRDMTLLIAKYEGGMGSRLHKESDLNYIAYAQWPDKKTRDAAGSNMPDEVHAIREAMNDACEKSDTIHEMEMVDDLLKPLA